MVDRVVQMEGDKLAVGVKNVTFNEPFFQGHYPSQPIMPGVLVLEALAQLSGLLLSRRLEHTGKVAFLIAMDRVKIRRPVRPGDQLMLHAEALHVRTRTGHTRCWATVGDETCAEAEIKFMLVDAEPI
jgi:beta-hydroxyacyl-ACP dehydratase FabZ